MLFTKQKFEPFEAVWGSWAVPITYGDGFIMPLGWEEELAKRDIEFKEIEVEILDGDVLQPQITARDKIPFHLDKVVDEDKLGREPIAKVFVDLVKKDIFTDQLEHSFMVHLQGAWGSGKSTFLNFIKIHLNKGDEKWIIVEYNAWQNQHISPPWWTLIDQIYRQSQKQLGPIDKCCLWVCEKWRRVIRYTRWQKIISLILTIVLSIIFFMNGTAILEFISESTISSGYTNNEESGITLAVFAKLLITLSSAVGIIYSFSKFLSTPFFLNSSHEAESFVSRATDPMKQIKKHFNGLIDNINSKKEKRQLAIFIDDIDRCNREFIVQLLEGIQTLFKEKRVLYIVAGEKRWITTSFANNYKEFATEEQGHRELGELFLEKAFQLSFRMPTVSPSARKKFWNHIIGVEEAQTLKKETSDLSDDEKQQINQAMAESRVDIGSSEFLNQLEGKFGVSPDAASNIVLDEKNRDNEEIRHLLVDFHNVISHNPRSIIRLANAYTIMRSTIIVERKNISGSKIFRWLIVEDLLPNIKSAVSSFKSERDVANYVSENAGDDKIRGICLELLSDTNGNHDGVLTLDEIKGIVEA